MKIETKHGPSGTAALCHLSPGDRLTAEGGALMAMGPGIDMTTSTRSRGKTGVMAGLKRMLSGESFFLNHFAARSESTLWLSTPLPGDLMTREMRGEGLVIAGGGYVASEDGVEIDLMWQGVKSIFTGAGIFWIRAKGTGALLLGSFGEIYPITVDGEYTVDTGHVVAFEETLAFTISRAGGSWIHSFLGGEGFTVRFKGKGIVWCQTHNPMSFGQELRPHLKARSN